MPRDDWYLRAWHLFAHAMQTAQELAEDTGLRQRVIREDGHDQAGPYRFRIVELPEVAGPVGEPCS